MERVDDLGVVNVLQVYLDEYVFRHNRRLTPMAAFQSLLGLGAVHHPTPDHPITRPTAA